MAAVPQQEPAKPAKMRARAKWIVYKVGAEENLQSVGMYEARNAEAACWQVAEGVLRTQCMEEDPPKLVAIKASEIDPKTYRLRSTVERVKA